MGPIKIQETPVVTSLRPEEEISTSHKEYFIVRNLQDKEPGSFIVFLVRLFMMV